VVTLEGETIEISGAMTGGGGPKQRGKMGTQVPKFENVKPELDDRFWVVLMDCPSNGRLGLKNFLFNF